MLNQNNIIDNYKKQFLQKLNELAKDIGIKEAYEKFIKYVACEYSIINTKATGKERIKTMEKLIDGEKEKDIIFKLRDIVKKSYEDNECQDFLGEVYNYIGLDDEYIMIKMSKYEMCQKVSYEFADDIIASQVHTHIVTDFGCGTGTAAIALYHALKEKEFDTDRVLFYQCEGNNTKALTAYVQFCVLGLQGGVIIASEESLKSHSLEFYETQNTWITPKTYASYSHYIVDNSKRVPKLLIDNINRMR